MFHFQCNAVGTPGVRGNPDKYRAYRLLCRTQQTETNTNPHHVSTATTPKDLLTYTVKVIQRTRHGVGGRLPDGGTYPFPFNLHQESKGLKARQKMFNEMLHLRVHLRSTHQMKPGASSPAPGRAASVNLWAAEMAGLALKQ